MVKDKIKFSIIIPIYNEIENIEILYHEIASALPSELYEYEVIFIDDGSTDGSKVCLQDLSQRYKNIRTIFHKQNFGQSAALISGAKSANYSLLISLDGDGQNDPADIPKLLAHFEKNKVIFGNRVNRDDNYLRKISSRVGNCVRQFILKDQCPDTGCSLKLFPKEAFLTLPHFNHIHRFLPALFKRAGFEVVNIPVNHRPRRSGVSKYGVVNRLSVGIYDLIGVRWLLKRPCAPEVVNCEH